MHEFGGSGNVQMTSLGESYSESINYSGTWCELALGGNVQLAKNIICILMLPLVRRRFSEAVAGKCRAALEFLSEAVQHSK